MKRAEIIMEENDVIEEEMLERFDDRKLLEIMAGGILKIDEQWGIMAGYLDNINKNLQGHLINRPYNRDITDTK